MKSEEEIKDKILLFENEKSLAQKDLYRDKFDRQMIWEHISQLDNKIDLLNWILSDE